jgi:predicted thioesterase
MELKIPVGVKHHLEVEVTKEHSARKFGSGMVDVFATPAMIATMERTAMLSILEFLPEGFTTVGTEVNIKHLKATPLGTIVICDSRLREVNGKKLVFELHAWDNKGMIGIGTHTRVIVEEKAFMDNLK